MRKAVIVMGLVLMVFALLTTPVLAVSPKKIPVTAKQLGAAIVHGPDSWEMELMKAGIGQHREFLGAGKVNLTIPGQPVLMGNSSSVINFMQNNKTGIWVMHFEMTWIFVGGKFEGNDQMKISPEGVEAHMILHGSGIFEGWKLALTGKAPPAPLTWEGFLLIP